MKPPEYLMSRYFAFARTDHSFIVSADSRRQLQEAIDKIRGDHPRFYEQLIAPGYFVVRARDIREAKSRRAEVTYDLPLFREQSTDRDG